MVEESCLYDPRKDLSSVCERRLAVPRTAPPVRPGPTCSGSALLPLATPRPDTVGDARAGGEEYLGLGELLDLDVHRLLRRLVPLLIISFSFVSITNKTKQLARIFPTIQNEDCLELKTEEKKAFTSLQPAQPRCTRPALF